MAKLVVSLKGSWRSSFIKQKDMMEVDCSLVDHCSQEIEIYCCYSELFTFFVDG